MGGRGWEGAAVCVWCEGVGAAPPHHPGSSPSPPPPSLPCAQGALSKLPGELAAQRANAALVEARLQREKKAWVVEGGALLPREFVQVGGWVGGCVGGGAAVCGGAPLLQQTAYSPPPHPHPLPCTPPRTA